MSSRTPSWISRRRVGSASRGRVRMTPHSTSTGATPPPPRTTPYPVFAVAGSMPRTSTECRLVLEGFHIGVGDVEVAPHLLHVVELLECLDQLEERRDVILPTHRHGVLRHHRDLGLARNDALRLECRLHRVQRRGIR